MRFAVTDLMITTLPTGEGNAFDRAMQRQDTGAEGADTACDAPGLTGCEESPAPCGDVPVEAPEEAPAFTGCEVSAPGCGAPLDAPADTARDAGDAPADTARNAAGERVHGFTAAERRALTAELEAALRSRR
jgi:hypothetical protein